VKISTVGRYGIDGTSPPSTVGFGGSLKNKTALFSIGDVPMPAFFNPKSIYITYVL